MMAQEERIAVFKAGEEDCHPLKSELPKWINKGWAVKETETKPTKGANK